MQQVQPLKSTCCQTHYMDDQDLVRHVLNGSDAAFKMLVEKHQRLVAHMVGRVVNRPEDLEEICQDVFVRVHDKLADFNFKSKLSTWIATIAYRMSINFVSKKELETISNDDAAYLERYWNTQDTPYRRLEQSDMVKVLNEMILTLPVQYRAILTLFHLEEMSYPEIMEVTGLPEGTVKNYLFRARKLLKEKMSHLMKKEQI